MVPLSELVEKSLRERAARERDNARVPCGEAEVRKACWHVAMAKGWQSPHKSCKRLSSASSIGMVPLSELVEKSLRERAAKKRHACVQCDESATRERDTHACR